MKNFSTIIVIFLSLIITLSASAQDDKVSSVPIETLYLKDGSVIRGYITEYVPNSKISIKTFDGNVLVYQIDKIEKITREIPSKETASDNTQQPVVVPAIVAPVYTQQAAQIRQPSTINFNYKPNDPGYEGVVEVGGLVGNGQTFFNFNTVHGYRIMPQFFIGVGAGVVTSFDEKNHYDIPVFLRIQTNILNTKVTPFVSLDAGASIPTYDGPEASALISPMFGVRVNTKSSLAFQLGFGYTALINNQGTGNNFSFRLGFIF